jgi:hypothetical protein
MWLRSLEEIGKRRNDSGISEAALISHPRVQAATVANNAAVIGKAICFRLFVRFGFMPYTQLGDEKLQAPIHIKRGYTTLARVA